MVSLKSILLCALYTAWHLFFYIYLNKLAPNDTPVRTQMKYEADNPRLMSKHIPLHKKSTYCIYCQRIFCLCGVFCLLSLAFVLLRLVIKQCVDLEICGFHGNG